MFFRMSRLFGACFGVVLALVPVSAAQQPHDTLRSTDVAALNRLAVEFSSQYERGHAAALDWAKRHGVPVRIEHADGRVIELMFLRDGRPIYYTTFNAVAADTVSTDELWPGGSSGLDLDGTGVLLHEWDAGEVRLSHQEFGGRVAWADDTAPGLHNHSTHVAGTIVAAGIDPNAHGMANTANLDAYDWEDDDGEMAAAAAAGARASNHSYGQPCGWVWDYRDDDEWAWVGDISVSTTEDAWFGFYNDGARHWDQIAVDAPFYLICKSAGNDRNDAHTGGHWVWSGGGWVWSTDPRDPDGGTTGHDSLPPKGCAKNVLTVGAVEDLIGGYTGPAEVVMSTFSSWGPTDDGRIKPDIVGNGVGLWSPVAFVPGSDPPEPSDSSYDIKSGTSMATPNVTGSLGLLIQHHRATHGGQDMRAAALKGLVIHTADEAGNDDGPDYSFGWGLFNALSAADHITLDELQPWSIQELSLSQGQTIEQTWFYDGTGPIKATICWTDPPGTPAEFSLDPPDLMLVNDLDLRVIGPGATEYEPWTLDPDDPNAPATPGDNFRDNVEVVAIDAPPAGEYTFQVTHKGTLTDNPQDFALILSNVQACDPHETAELTASDGELQDFFGNSVSISGDTALIGAPGDDDNGERSGSAYIFQYDGSNWVREAKLLAGDEYDRFGQSVSISGDTAIIGAPGQFYDYGYACVFEYDGSNWVWQAGLGASDGGAGNYFGSPVVISGDTAVIGATGDDDNGEFSGSAYVFRYNGSNWEQEAKLLPDDGAEGDTFGYPVAVSGATIVVGARYDDDNGEDSGSAYVFWYDGSSWAQRAKLLPSDGVEGDFFGSVAISGETAVIGAHGDDDNGPYSGSAYVFRYNGSTWVQQAKLIPSNGAAYDHFGSSVSVSAAAVVIAAHGDDSNGENSGSAYVFRYNGANWVQQAKLLASDGAAGDQLGYSVAISGVTALIGASQYYVGSGSAYVFDLDCAFESIPGDCDGDGDVDIDDFNIVAGCMAGPGVGYPANCDAADLNGDGDVDLADFADFQVLFQGSGE